MLNLLDSIIQMGTLILCRERLERIRGVLGRPDGLASVRDTRGLHIKHRRPLGMLTNVDLETKNK